MTRNKRLWPWVMFLGIGAEVVLGIVALATGHWFVALSPLVAAVGLTIMFLMIRRQQNRR